MNSLAVIYGWTVGFPVAGASAPATSVDQRGVRRRLWRLGRALLGALVAAAGAAPAFRAQGERQGPIGVVNAAGRSGAYFIPAGPRTQALPLLVVLHATGGSGAGAIPVFRALAQARRFAIVAPDSRRSPGGEFTWEVGSRPGEVTADVGHVLDCVQWVRSQAGLVVDASRVLIAGYSGGGSSAPYIGSIRPTFTHVAVLHGGVFPGGIGPRRVPAWFSTGEEDPLRPVAAVRQSADALSRLGFPVTFRSYRGGHAPGDDEVRDLVSWWLGP